MKFMIWESEKWGRFLQKRMANIRLTARKLCGPQMNWTKKFDSACVDVAEDKKKDGKVTWQRKKSELHGLT